MKKRISILLVVMMIFSMTSSFVFAEGLDVEGTPAEETTLEGAANPEETPEEVAEPVAEGEENNELPEETLEEGKVQIEGEVSAQAISNVKAVLADNTNNVLVTWNAADTDTPKVEFIQNGEVKYASGVLPAGTKEFKQTGVAGGTYIVEVSFGDSKGSAEVTVPEGVTGFATFSAYKSVVLEWNKPAKNPTRYEIWSDGAKLAEFVYPNVPGSPYDNSSVYNYQCTNAKDEGKHTYAVKAVYPDYSVQSEVLTDQMLMPMYVKCTFTQTKVLTAHDGSKHKHKFKKGQTIKAFTFVKGQYRFRYEGHLYYCNYNRLTNKKCSCYYHR
jgi:hypothetical protein